MRKENLITLSVVIIILFIAGAIIYSKNIGFTVKDLPSEEIARWIGEHSVLYARATCSHCREQEDLFGANVKYLNILDGDKEENWKKFIDAGINQVPTWVINGQKYVGVQSIEKLKELTGYQ